MEKNELQFKKEIKDQISKSAKSWFDNIDGAIKQKLESALLSLLGLENGHSGHYEIDHCNGRNSVFLDILRDKAKVQAEKLVEKVKLLDADIDLYKDAFKREFKQQMSYKISELARDAAKEKAKEITDKLMESEIKRFLTR